MEQFQIDQRDGKVKPCTTCEAVVQETLEEWDKQERDDSYIEDLNQPLEAFLLENFDGG